MPYRSSRFLIASSAGVATLTAASAPSPLYPVYQRLWGFSSATLTLVFAVYVFALLGALLTVGSLSDVVGRRPVATASLLLLCCGMVLFAVADGTGGLIAARVIQGFAVGAATGTTTAMITDAAPNARTGSVMSGTAAPLGIAIGAVLSGTLVEFAPHPRQLVFWVFGAAYALLAALVWAVPEPTHRQPPTWASVRRSVVPSVGLPRDLRPVFRSLLPSIAATWALAGLYLSLGASVIRTVLGVRSHFTVSLVLGAFFAAGILGSAVQTALPAWAQRWSGYGALATGVLVTIPATALEVLPLYAAGSVIAGFGFGATFRVAVGTLADAAPAAERGRVFATMYIVSYLAFSIPALIAGLAVEVVGLRTTTVAYGAFELALIGIASASAAHGRRRTVHPTRTDHPDERT
ncbi:MAG TPA: MFS transporter [Plantibacter sp.]|uniref:MFS transporter n=1 Tax=unclassified Plantibacter TaxID=2624265 RepID=UPI002B72A989|nr:MFS transporter [Plantibacter sp.]